MQLKQRWYYLPVDTSPHSGVTIELGFPQSSSPSAKSTIDAGWQHCVLGASAISACSKIDLAIPPRRGAENHWAFQVGLNSLAAFRIARPSSKQYTLRSRGRTLWDDTVHHYKLFSPGPIYDSLSVDNSGKKMWADNPNMPFGSAARFLEPELNFPGPFISFNDHSCVFKLSSIAF